MLSWYQHIPSHIDPVAFALGSFSVRWYSISYIVGFLIVYLVLLWRVKRGEAESIFEMSKGSTLHVPPRVDKRLSSRVEAGPRSTIFDFLLLEFFIAVIFGRIGYAILYNPNFFLAHPLAIISPYDSASGILTGFYGMSYYGAMIGAIGAGYLFARLKKISFLRWADFVVPAVPLGYFFGRVGNFLNGELFGRVTTFPLGMYFVNDSKVLRHPSQLYEALFEGMLLFLILWPLRKKGLEPGILLAMYIIGYGSARFFVEMLRSPDPQVGFLLAGLTLGQILSSVMAFGGVIFLVLIYQKKWYTVGRNIKS